MRRSPVRPLVPMLLILGAVLFSHSLLACPSDWPVDDDSAEEDDDAGDDDSAG